MHFSPWLLKSPGKLWSDLIHDAMSSQKKWNNSPIETLPEFSVLQAQKSQK